MLFHLLRNGVILGIGQQTSHLQLRVKAAACLAFGCPPDERNCYRFRLLPQPCKKNHGLSWRDARRKTAGRINRKMGVRTWDVTFSACNDAVARGKSDMFAPT